MSETREAPMAEQEAGRGEREFWTPRKLHRIALALSHMMDDLATGTFDLADDYPKGEGHPGRIGPPSLWIRAAEQALRDLSGPTDIAYLLERVEELEEALREIAGGPTAYWSDPVKMQDRARQALDTGGDDAGNN